MECSDKSGSFYFTLFHNDIITFKLQLRATIGNFDTSAINGASCVQAYRCTDTHWQASDKHFTVAVVYVPTSSYDFILLKVMTPEANQKLFQKY